MPRLSSMMAVNTLGYDAESGAIVAHVRCAPAAQCCSINLFAS
jgi:hypothetical protein